MVTFADTWLPVQYAGVLAEHRACRERSALFDVSHMGQLMLQGPGVAEALEKLIPIDLVDLPVGRMRYGFFTLPSGGLLDDLMATRWDDGVMLVVNGACKAQDIAHLQAHLPAAITLTHWSDRALLAVQGPTAVHAVQALLPGVEDMNFMSARSAPWQGHQLYLSRSGYTGEDGFEISLPAAAATGFAEALLAQGVTPAGLGARDSLRLEAGLPLYGHDLNSQTSPLAAGLGWAISPARRPAGARAGTYLGAEALDTERQQGSPRKRVGFKGLERAPIREGTPLVNAEGVVVGEVCSGTLSPSLNLPIGMAWVDATVSALDTPLWAEMRGKRWPVVVSKMPFVPQRYVRKP